MSEIQNHYPWNRGDSEEETLLEELKRYQSAGIQITLGHAAASLDYIAKTCGVRERGTYMCDFISDDQDRLMKINFDQIRDE